MGRPLHRSVQASRGPGRVARATGSTCILIRAAQCKKGPDANHADWPLCPDHKNMQERVMRRALAPAACGNAHNTHHRSAKWRWKHLPASWAAWRPSSKRTRANAWCGMLPGRRAPVVRRCLSDRAAAKGSASTLWWSRSTTRTREAIPLVSTLCIRNESMHTLMHRRARAAQHTRQRSELQLRLFLPMISRICRNCARSGSSE
jgi:hypothetical protein